MELGTIHFVNSNNGVLDAIPAQKRRKNAEKRGKLSPERIVSNKILRQ